MRGVEDNAVKDSEVEDSAMQDSVMKGGAVAGGAVEDSAQWRVVRRRVMPSPHATAKEIITRTRTLTSPAPSSWP